MTAHPRAADLEEGLAYAMHARLAAHYERHLVDECGYRSHEMIAETALSLGPRDGLWLDFGAGSGLVGRALAAHSTAIQLIAIDRSRAMLDLIDLPIYVSRLEADCNDVLALHEQSFDGALAAGLLEHLPDPEPLFRNVAGLLCQGGHFLFTYPPNQSGGTAMADDMQALVSHDVSALGRQLARCGFTITSEREYPAYRNGARGWMVHRLAACRLGRGPAPRQA